MIEQLDMFAMGQTTASDTRLAALRSIEPDARAICARVLRYMINLHRRGGTGITADECATNLRLSPLTVRPRFTELKKDGLIRDTGKRRANRSGRSASVMDVTSLALSTERN